MENNYLKYLMIITITIFFGFGCSGNESETSSQEDQSEENIIQAYANPQLLVDVSELETIRLSEDNLMIIDAREQTGNTLIPGAVHFAAVQELVDSNHSIQGYLVGADEFEQKMREIGLENNHRVIIYDSGNNLAAARLFYALDYYGFTNASLLNGGLSAWLAGGNEIIDTPETYMEGNFSADIQEALICDFEYVTTASTSDDIVIFDTRSAGEYSGETVRAERGGHIPNAAHLEWSDVLSDGAIPYFRSATQISQLLQERGITPDKEIIPHCQSNVRGSHAYFTLRLMGYDSVRPYEGSWFEYGNRADAEIVSPSDG